MKGMSDSELVTLLNDLESFRVERKSNFSGEVATTSRQVICAFCNDISNSNQMGVLFIGAKDNGAPAEIQVTEDLLNSLANIAADGQILPLPVMLVEKRMLKDAELAVVQVLPSDMPPVRYKGTIWIRTGARRKIANEQEERILIEKRRYKNIPFDIRPVPPSTITDLSKSVFENEYLPNAFAPEIVEENNRSFEERLASLRMISTLTDTTPTLLGLLALGIEPQDFLPGAYIQFVRIDGTELEDPIIDEAEIGGTIAEMLRRANEKLMAHNRKSLDIIGEPTHQIEMLYPPAAILQLLYNAVLHRTYEGTNSPVRITWFNNRIEIINPGGPYGNVTVENFGTPGITDYRNPNIADMLKTLGFVQKFGRGMQIVRSEMKKNGNPPPLFEPTQNNVVCTLKIKEGV